MTTSTLDGTLAAYIDAARTWLRGVANADIETRSGLHAARTGVDHPQFNTIWWHGPASAEQVGAALDHVADLPHSLNIGGPQADEVTALLTTRGLQVHVEMAGMVFEDPVRLAVPATDLDVRDARETGSLADFRLVLAPAFEMPDDVIAQVMPDRQLDAAGATYLVGYRDGRPVATACSITVDETVAIFCVATLPEAQRRGYGAVLTARAAAAGIEHGARRAYLEATPQGDALYRRMGFTEINRWTWWLPAQPEA